MTLGGFNGGWQVVLLLLIQVTNIHAYIARTTHVNIHMPSSLHQTGGYEHSMGHFGFAAMTRAGHSFTEMEMYGSMSLRVEAVTSDLCHWNNTHWEQPDNHEPYMLIVPRSSNCSFVTQTRRAQHTGAAGIVIVDNTCICAEANEIRPPLCKNNNATDTCQQEPPVIKDDGSGGDISIPTIFLKKQDGEAIWAQLQAKEAVMMDLRWQSLPEQNTTNKNKLHYGMWLDLHDTQHTSQFTQNIQQIALAVAPKSSFHPSYMFYNGTSNNCVGRTGEHQCYNTCTNNGRYCYPSIYGAQIVMEILHRLCIWKNHGDEQNDKTTGVKGEAFWKYITYFDQNCAAHVYGYNESHISPDKAEECRQSAYKVANLDAGEVQHCIEDTGGVDMGEDKPNNLLDAELATKDRYGVWSAPAIWVDGKTLPTYWREPSAIALLEAVCVGFRTSGRVMPKVCTSCLSQDSIWQHKSEAEMIECAKQHAHDDDNDDGSGGKGRDHNKHAHKAAKVLFWLASMFAIGGALWYGNKKLKERAESENGGGGGGGLLQNALLGGGDGNGGGMGGRFMDPIMSYMPLNQNNAAGNSPAGAVGGGEQTIFYE